jgi:hypothetical protein
MLSRRWTNQAKGQQCGNEPGLQWSPERSFPGAGPGNPRCAGGPGSRRYHGEYDIVVTCESRDFNAISTLIVEGI